MELINVKGLVLKEQSYRENDKIVWILCENIGKISILAKSAKKNNNNLFVLTQPLSLVQLNLKKGKNFYYIIDGSLIKSIDFINNSDKIFYFTYVFELLDIVFQEKENIDVKFFKFLIRFILFLESYEEDIDMLIRMFELKLLNQVGCNFGFEYCYYCSKKIKDKFVFYSFSLDNVVCINCSKLKEFKVENRIINIIRFLSNIDIVSISKLKVNKEDLKLIFKICRAFLEQNLVKMPKSLEILNKFSGGCLDNG